MVIVNTKGILNSVPYHIEVGIDKILSQVDSYVPKSKKPGQIPAIFTYLKHIVIKIHKKQTLSILNRVCLHSGTRKNF